MGFPPYHKVKLQVVGVETSPPDVVSTGGPSDPIDPTAAKNLGDSTRRCHRCKSEPREKKHQAAKEDSFMELYRKYIMLNRKGKMKFKERLVVVKTWKFDSNK